MAGRRTFQKLSEGAEESKKKIQNQSDNITDYPN